MQIASFLRCIMLPSVTYGPLSHFFPSYLTNGTIFGKKLWNINCVFWFSLQCSSETFLIHRITQRYIIINTHSVDLKYPLFWSEFKEINFLDRLAKNPQVLNFMKTLQMVAEISMQTDGQTRQDVANSPSRNSVNAPKSSWFDVP